MIGIGRGRGGGTRSGGRSAFSRRWATHGSRCSRGVGALVPASWILPERCGSWRSTPRGGCTTDGSRGIPRRGARPTPGGGGQLCPRTPPRHAAGPRLSGGPHGGHFGWQDHVFPLREVKSWLWIPLPLIGSTYPIARESGISSQDAPSTAYRRMRAALDSAFAGARPLIYAAGHDHALQVITGTSARYELVSGAGTFGHLDRVSALDSTRFARSASGFMRVEFLRDGRARVGVTVVDRSGGGVEAFALWLQ